MKLPETKFNIGQTVFVVEVKNRWCNLKCRDCNGKGFLLLAPSEKSKQIKCLTCEGSGKTKGLRARRVAQEASIEEIHLYADEDRTSISYRTTPCGLFRENCVFATKEKAEQSIKRKKK